MLSKEELERLFIEEYLDGCGDKGWEIEQGDRPDCILHRTKDSKTYKVGVEIVRYSPDSSPGGKDKCPPKARLITFWKKVQTICTKRVTEDDSLKGINVTVRFNEAEVQEKLPDSTAFAENLLHAIKGNLPEVSEELKPVSIKLSKTGLFRAVNSLHCIRSDTAILGTSPHDWVCGNQVSGHPGLVPTRVSDVVRHKIDKSENYNCKDYGEMWLLIVASDSSSFGAGPFPFESAWRSEELEALKSLCRESPFDKIVFWERRLCWCKSLKPWEESVNPFGRSSQSHGC